VVWLVLVTCALVTMMEMMMAMTMVVMVGIVGGDCGGSAGPLEACGVGMTGCRRTDIVRG
jgi:hypothetical protein